MNQEQTELLRGQVHMSMGEASMCWNPRPTGVFVSQEAIHVGDRLTAYISKNYTPNGDVSLNPIVGQMQLDMMLRLEERIEGHKRSVDEALTRKVLAAQNGQDDMIEFIESEIDGYIENWLNVLDRLASMIIRGMVPEMDWKADYQRYLSGLQKSFPDAYSSESHGNISTLIDKWRD